MATIVCIVEGHGDVEAIPVLLRRLAALHAPELGLRLQSLRIPRNKIVRELERDVELAARLCLPHGAILVVFDSDQDCPAELAPALLARARQARRDIPISVVLAKCEFESWFLAAADSLKACRGLPHDLQPPLDPEGVRGAKEWLENRMDNRKYSETIGQPAFAAKFDVELARRARSFDKLYRDVTGLLGLLAGEQTGS